jgi:hypothetical protein
MVLAAKCEPLHEIDVGLRGWSQRCMTLWFAGAILSLRWRGAGWTSSSRERHDHARRPSSDTAIASFARDAEPGADQPEDCVEMAQDGNGPISGDRAKGGSVNDPDASGGGNGCGVPPAHAAAVERLLLRVEATDPAPDPVSAASLPPAARRQRGSSSNTC